MIKKTITYDDLDGNKITEDFYFHLSKAEITEMELSEEGGLAETLQKLIRSTDGKSIIKHFKKILLGSYGQRSMDNKRFVKSKALRDDFEQSDAYSTLFMELISDAEASSAFIRGIIPADLAVQIPQDSPTMPSPDAIQVLPDTTQPLQPTAEELEILRKLREAE